MNTALKDNLYKLSKNRKVAALSAFILVLPVLISFLNYEWAALYLNAYPAKDADDLFYKIVLLFSNKTNFVCGILQSYYVFLFPVLVSVASNICHSDELSYQVKKHTLAYHGATEDFLAKLLVHVLLILLFLFLNFLTVLLCYHVFSALLHNGYPATHVLLPGDGMLSFGTIWKTAVLIFMVSIVDYLAIYFISTFSKNTFVPTCILALLHVIQPSPYVFVSSYYILINRVLFAQTVSLIYFYPKRYISNDLLDTGPAVCYCVLGVSFLVFLILSYMRRNAHK